jgi:hypothetical protein
VLSQCCRSAMVVLSFHFGGMDVGKPQNQDAKRRQMLVNSESRKDGDHDIASLIAAEGLQCRKLIACGLRKRVLVVRSLAGVVSVSKYHCHSINITV